MVLLAGLTAGYFASRVAHRLHEKWLSDLPAYYSRGEIPVAAMFNLSTIYDSSKEDFQEVLKLGQNALREAARRRQVLQQSRERVTTNPEAYEQLILQSEREVDLHRLLDYYNQFYLHYYRWLDTGNAQSAVQFKLALGQFKATLDYVLEKQKEESALTVLETEELQRAIRIAEQSMRTIRWSKVVVVFLVFLLVMGIPRLIRDSGYKKFAGSLYFDALFRPRDISDLNRWHSLLRIALILPLLYLFGLVIFSSFISWRIPLIFGALGLIPVIILILLTGKQKNYSALLVSYMAPKMLVLILVLGIVALRGQGFFWYRLWSTELFRMLFLSLLFMLILRKLQVNMILARKWSHRNRNGSAAMVGMALGLQFLICGVFLYCFGPEESLAALNSELLLLPAYLLETPPKLLNWMMTLAGILTLSSLSIFIFNRRRKHVPLRST